jgi:hypothetical protein
MYIRIERELVVKIQGQIAYRQNDWTLKRDDEFQVFVGVCHCSSDRPYKQNNVIQKFLQHIS